jgi:hypothetical protein
MLKKHPSPSLCAALLALSLIAVPAFTQTVHSRPNITADKSAAAAKDQSLDYTTSWIGNTFGGNDPNYPNNTLYHVPEDMDSIYVTPDGRVFSNVIWEEGGRAVSVFNKNGKLISPLNDQDGSPNWANGGGVAVAAVGNQIFVGYSPGGTGVSILDAKDMTNTGLSLSGSSTLDSSHGIFGMTISKGKLYITENDVPTATGVGVVEVFDIKTLTRLSTFPVDNPVRIAVDQAGGLWVSHRDTTVIPFDINGQMGLPTVDHYDSSGNWINSITLPDNGEVGALAINNEGALLVADDGPDQNIKIYANLQKNPTLVSTFGVKGGNYAGPVPGRVGPLSPLRFRGITGVGTDADGNIYVSQSGFGLDMGVGHGLTLQSYTPYGTLNWERDGLGWTSLAGIDPHSDTDAYDAYHHYKIDYTQTNRVDTLVADTYNRFNYPDDVRVTSIMGGGEIKYIHGKKFLLVRGQIEVELEIYRFEGDSEIAIPCVAFDYGSAGGGQDFVVQPTDGEWIWRDVNGDGQMSTTFGGLIYDPAEFTEPANNSHRDGANFFMDDNGDVWQQNYNSNTETSIHLRRYQFQGFDQYGAPIYDFNHMQIYNVGVGQDIPDLTTIQQVVFQPHASKGGTLFVSGTPIPNTNPPQNFVQIARYDHWDLGNRKATWVVNIPYDLDPNNFWSPESFALAGDFFFVDFNVPHYNLVYSTKDGAYVGKFASGKNVGGLFNIGNSDESHSNLAFQRSSNGEYVVIQEEDFQAKYLMYRWFAPDTLPTPPPPPPPPAAFTESVADDEAFTVTWSPEPAALTYTLSSSLTSGGPYTPVSQGIFTTSFNQVGVQPNGKKFYFVIAAQSDTGVIGPNSPEIVVMPVAAGTTYEAENGILTGCAQTYPGTLDSNYLRVGCLAPGSSITLNNVTVPTTGTYAMRIYYGNGDSNPSDPNYIDVSVNGGAAVTSPYLTYTGDYSIPSYVIMNVQLNSNADGGPNTIVLQATPNGSPDIDRIVVPFAPM